MRVVLQRVTHGQVTVAGSVTGAVERGFVALVGVTHGDSEADAERLARKTAHLRVFDDEQGKMKSLGPRRRRRGIGRLAIYALRRFTERPPTVVHGRGSPGHRRAAGAAFRRPARR